MIRTTVSVLAVLSLFAVACNNKQAKEPVSTVPVMSAMVPNVHVDDDIARICKIQFDDVKRAPKFDYDQADLLLEDRDVLEQVAKCMTRGPLAGRHVSLVGRADPRGEAEYNMALGDHRADAVSGYLSHFGVPSAVLVQTSRGELDATGTDDDTWRLDRRVDLVLVK